MRPSASATRGWMRQGLSKAAAADSPARFRGHRALRAWMGYECSAAELVQDAHNHLDSVMGPAGQRGTMIKHTRDKLRTEWDHNFNFTGKQVRLLREMRSPFVMISCCAGAGNITLLLCISLWILASAH